MSDRGRARFISIILAISVFLAGCTSIELPRGQDAVWHLVIIGDSTLWGVGDAYAVLIERDIRVKVDLRDFSIGGKWTSDLKAIWAEIFKPRRGKATTLRAVDIYNPSVKIWGKYGVFEACTECWVNQSNTVRLAAEAYNIPFLSRYDAFNGMSHSEDPIEKGYIGSDNIHLSERGSQYIAELLSGMGYEPVSPP